MFLNRRRATSLCLLTVSLALASGGEENRKSRSIEEPISLSAGLNSYKYHFRKRDYESREKLTPTENDRFDRVGDRTIDRADISEDARRVVRQIKRHRPGLFWTLARVVFETVNETKSAIGQISDLVSNNLVPDTTRQRGNGTSQPLGNEATRTPQSATSTNASSTTAPTESSMSEEPFKLTPSELRSLVRRNLRGLVRLFDIEWRDALNQSHANVREFQRDLGIRISPFLRDNPDVV